MGGGFSEGKGKPEEQRGGGGVGGVTTIMMQPQCKCLASQSLKLKMKLKLKCQLEWNENDIKTEPTQPVTTATMAITTKGVPVLSACIFIDSRLWAWPEWAWSS